MGPATRNLKQTITYWPPGSRTEWGFSGYGAPEKIRGRWTEWSDTVKLATGEEYVSRAVVFVDRDLASEGYLALGDHVLAADPTLVNGAYEIKAFRATPDLRTLEQERKAIL